MLSESLDAIAGILLEIQPLELWRVEKFGTHVETSILLLVTNHILQLLRAFSVFSAKLTILTPVPISIFNHLIFHMI